MTTSSEGEAVNLWCDKTVKRDKESSENESEQRGLYEAFCAQERNEWVESLVKKLHKKRKENLLYYSYDFELKLLMEVLGSKLHI